MQCVMYINLKKKKDVNEERKYVKESENTDRENDSQKSNLLVEFYHLRVAQNILFFLRENEYSTAI